MNAELVKALATEAKPATATRVNFILFDVDVEVEGEELLSRKYEQLAPKAFYSRKFDDGSTVHDIRRWVDCSLVQSLHKNTRFSVSFSLYDITVSASLNSRTYPWYNKRELQHERNLEFYHFLSKSLVTRSTVAALHGKWDLRFHVEHIVEQRYPDSSMLTYE
jgi:hypothetical protein